MAAFDLAEGKQRVLTPLICLGIVILAFSSGIIDSDDTSELIFFFLALPATLASVFAVAAAVAVGILRYFYWISGSG